MFACPTKSSERDERSAAHLNSEDHAVSHSAGSAGDRLDSMVRDSALIERSSSTGARARLLEG
jgi:hypothetical protein